MAEEALKIDADKVVTFHYNLRASDDSFVESSQGKSPVVYMHGHHNIVPGLESEMLGKRRGEKFTATVAPENAYGLRDPNAVQRVPIKHLASKGRLVPGQMVAVNTNSGARHGLVLKVGHFNVDVDLNHPLAGKTLIFDIEIVAVRAATEEELAHGHAHGPEGHGHDH
ncbi:MAG TPA: peptidylprolyl isomerase [Gammaproteobacteria bacterium]|nr:peptidylprolyl isomerase [Gammaproteobacteria bacterium]